MCRLVRIILLSGSRFFSSIYINIKSAYIQFLADLAEILAAHLIDTEKCAAQREVVIFYLNYLELQKS